jgi:membrane protein
VAAGNFLARARAFLADDLWSAQPEHRARLSAIRLLQFSIMVVEGFVRDRLLLRATGLAYFTVLSVVPLLAFAVSIAGALGVGTETFVGWVVRTFAAGSPSAQAEILTLVGHVDFGRLGTVSAVVLFLTTLLAISNVESALNGIWGVAEARGWGRRFSDYLAVLVIGPVLGGLALSLSTSMYHPWLQERLLRIALFERLYHVGLTQLPTLILSAAFAFLYAFLPNTRVRWSSATIGGVVAGVLTVAAQRAYLDLSVGVTRANLFFGSFAALPLLFAWIYVLWAVVLFGAEIAFAHQNLAQYRREVRGAPAGPAEREAIGLRVALEVARRFRDGAEPLDAGALSDALDVPVRTVREVADRLRAANILLLQVREGSDEALQLGRPAERISVQELLAALRGGRERSGGDAHLAELVDNVLRELEAGASQAARNRSLADLLEGLPPAGRVDRPTHAL